MAFRARRRGDAPGRRVVPGAGAAAPALRLHGVAAPRPHLDRGLLSAHRDRRDVRARQHAGHPRCPGAPPQGRDDLRGPDLRQHVLLRRKRRRDQPLLAGHRQPEQLRRHAGGPLQQHLLRPGGGRRRLRADVRDRHSEHLLLPRPRVDPGQHAGRGLPQLLQLLPASRRPHLGRHRVAALRARLPQPGQHRTDHARPGLAGRERAHRGRGLLQRGRGGLPVRHEPRHRLELRSRRRDLPAHPALLQDPPVAVARQLGRSLPRGHEPAARRRLHGRRETAEPCLLVPHRRLRHEHVPGERRPGRSHGVPRGLERPSELHPRLQRDELPLPRVRFEVPGAQRLAGDPRRGNGTRPALGVLERRLGLADPRGRRLHRPDGELHGSRHRLLDGRPHELGEENPRRRRHAPGVLGAGVAQRWQLHDEPGRGPGQDRHPAVPVLRRHLDRFRDVHVLPARGDRSLADVVRRAAFKRGGGPRVADRVGGRQPRLPPLPLAGGRRSVAAPHTVTGTEPGLLGHGGELHLARQWPSERHPLLLPPRRRGHALPLHLPRPHLRRATGGCNACAS